MPPKGKDGLSNFKISDLRKPGVKGKRRPQRQAEAPPEDESVGFPAIESRLASGTVESVADELRASYEALEDLATGTNMKTKAPARKAMAAYERTADLFEYLFATKSQMASGGE